MKRRVRWGAGTAGFTFLANAAHAADATPGFQGDPVFAIGILLIVVAVLWYFITGVLGVAARDTSDEDEAGVGLLEGIDEDDDKPRRR
jgi:hypothetical protein